MKYRTKLYLSFVCVTVVSVLLALAIAYYKTRKQLFQEHRSKVESVAATSAPFIDGNALKNIQTKADESSPTYLRIKKQLQEIRNINRRPDLYVKFVYILKPTNTTPPKLAFVVDAEESDREISHVGEEITTEDSGDLLNHLNQVYSPKDFVQDPWGTFLYGYAPIYDSDGKYVATLGVDIYAHEITTRLNRLIYYGLYALLASIVLAIILASILSKRATYALGDLCRAVEAIGRGNFDYRMEIETKDEFSHLAQDVNQMAIGLKEREWLKTNFSRYVSNHVMEEILHSEASSVLEGKRKKITVLFSDIRQFTLLSEKLPPEEIVSLLNEYFEQMLEVIFSHSGTLDKFIGDGIMVEFGTPLEDSEQEKHAVLTGIDMQESLHRLCEKWKSEGKEPIEMGVGIHTGEAVVGNIGSERRMEYTAIGDTVNVAARLEKENKNFSTSIIVSQTTWEAIKDEFDFKLLGEVTLSGRAEKITVYTMESYRKPESS